MRSYLDVDRAAILAIVLRLQRVRALVLDRREYSVPQTAGASGDVDHCQSLKLIARVPQGAARRIIDVDASPRTVEPVSC